MPTTLRKYIESLTSEQLWEIADSLDSDSRFDEGSTLHSYTQHFLSLVNYNTAQVPLLMTVLGFEAYRCLAVRSRYLPELGELPPE